jgi:uncharacterized protein YggE
MKKYLLIFCFGLFFVLLSAFIWNYVSSPLVVTVVGRGEVTNPKANFSVSFSLVADAADTSSAISLIRAKTTSIKTVLENFGVKLDDILESQTSTVPLSSLVGSASGFRSTVSLSVTKVESGKVDALIALLYSSGATMVGQPAINTDDQTALEQQAYNLAVKDAASQAKKIASSNWKMIYKATDITKSTSPSSSVTGKDSANSGYSKVTTLVNVSYKMW